MKGKSGIPGNFADGPAAEFAEFAEFAKRAGGTTQRVGGWACVSVKKASQPVQPSGQVLSGNVL